MNPRPPAEVAVLEPPLGGGLALSGQADLPRERPARSDWSAMVRDELAAVWRPFVASRMLVLAVGAVTMLVLGAGAAQWAFDPANVSISFGRVGNLFAAPLVRFDSIFYLQIAQHGYQHMQETAFFPLYPLLIHVVSWFTGSFVLAGVLISLSAMLATLVLLRRLTALEFDGRTADLAVRLLAFGPMAFFLSAVYTESLFMALSTGTFYAARRGRWALAGILGGLAATARSGGILLLVPVLIMFFWGPRSDRQPLRSSLWKPRYRLSPAVLWVLLIPLGVEVFNLYFMLLGYGSGAPLHAQESFLHHNLTLPVVAAWQGAVAAWHQVQLILSGASLNTDTSQALFQFPVLLVTTAALIGMFRRMPLAYGMYTLLGTFVMSLSAPTIGDPLAGFARYASLRFPLFMFAAVWAIEHRRSRVVLIGFALLLVVFTAQFASWQVVGSPVL